MFSHFFIRRPIFASVLSIVIFLAGLVAALNLPLAQYPQITPPSIMVQCNYPGADARVVAESVAAPIEQQVNGVEDMLYMVSQSNNDGSYTLTVTFKPGVNLNFAQVLVQNRINLALPLLPDVVKQAGVTTRKRNPDILLVVGVYSPHGRYDQIYLSNFVTIKIKDEIARVDGVGDVNQFGQQDYSMRLWLDPDRLAELNLSATDVTNAVREQNMQVAAGHFGQQPANRPFEVPITVLGRLSEPAEFENIIIRTDADGRKVRVKDVGQVELGARNLDTTSKLDGMPNASLAVWALPDANSIATAERVKKRMEELKKSFPDDIDYGISLDMTPFMTQSIKEVFRTLVEAVVLVAIVVLIFLQNWRSALIPLLAVPVAIVGTFAAMAAIGFSLNNLTLFGLVLAIGIVVDDAIVVVEAIEHHIEQGLTPRQAAHRAMEQVSGPVVAVALVLSAVFVPCAFISGITGMFFRQFALTIAVSTVISAFNSLTFSPALAAILLPPRGARKDLLGRLLDFCLGWFFRLFNWGFRRSSGLYLGAVQLALRGSVIVLVLYSGMLALTWIGFAGLPSFLTPAALRGLKIGPLELSTGLPRGYIPNSDQGRFYIAVQLPDATSMERTQKIVDHIRAIVQPMDGVVHTTEIAGQSFTFNANGSNFGQFFCTLDDYEKRADPSMTSTAITARVQAELDRKVPEAQCSLFTPPPVSGLGSASGFKIIIEDRGDLGFPALEKQVEQVMAAGNGGHFKLTGASLAALHEEQPPLSQPVLAALNELKDHDYLTRDLFLRAIGDALAQAGFVDKAERDRVQNLALSRAENRKVVSHLFSVFRANVPQLYIDLDRAQCQTMGVNPQDVFSTLQIYLGSYYVNDFNKFGRTWQVNVQASGEFRNDPARIKLLKVRNAQGQMVPLGAVCNVREIGGPINIGRYNMYPAAAILGATEPGVSSGQGIAEMEQICREVLSQGMAFEWTEINFMEVDAAGNVWNQLIFPLAVVFVFLVLAAQYESWALPLAVILVVPMCILGSLAGVAATRSQAFADLCARFHVTAIASDINIFTQIGFVVLVGLASKNAILIVEFAKKKHEAGFSRREATLQACRLRLRPILMTSFAFILGVVPLLVGAGAGFEMRRTLGTAVFSGMLGVTFFGLLLTPVFFYVIEWFVERPLFSSARAELFGRVLRYALAVVTLGLFWLPTLLGRALQRPARALVGRIPKPGRATRTVAGNGRVARAESSKGVVPAPSTPFEDSGRATRTDSEPVAEPGNGDTAEGNGAAGHKDQPNGDGAASGGEPSQVIHK
jgi:multidrug efflux pump